MAFFSKAGNILRQISQKGIGQEMAASKPSILQTIRCMSTSKVFVGGLAWSTDDTSLREAFSNYGEVAEARVIQDRETGRSRGFGFVTFDSEEAASAAIQALDGRELHGRTVRVNYANERPRSFGGGGGGFGGGGYGSGGGGYGSGGYGSGGGGYGGGNYGGGGGGYGGNTYGGQGGGNTYGGQGSGGYGAGVGDLAGGDSYASPGDVPSSGGYGSFNATAGSSPGDGLGEQFGNDNTGDVGGDNGGFNPEEPAGGELRDDDVSGDFANRRG